MENYDVMILFSIDMANKIIRNAQESSLRESRALEILEKEFQVELALLQRFFNQKI